ALKLADADRQADQPQKARAALETALDLLSDPGHRQLVRCRLAAEALAEGDLASAAGWLEGGDPAPDVIEIDSAIREVGARVKTAQGDFAGVLSLAGQRAGNVPVHAMFRESIARCRIHALESLGHLDEARRELDDARQEHGSDAFLAALARES